MTRTWHQPFWLLSEAEGKDMNPLILRRDAGPTLPVFSFEEEAILYRLFRATLGGMRAAEVSPGDLASLLCGPCSRVEHVALDPLPEMEGEAAVSLVTLSREAFLGMLARRGATTSVFGERGGYPGDLR